VQHELTGEGVGELVYSGPNVMLGYAESPDDLSAGRTIDELRTGDLARRTADGLYEIVGRRSRFAKVFGVRVDLDRVEAMFAQQGVLARCAAVDDVIVAATVDGRGADSALRAVRSLLGLPSHAVALHVLAEIPRLPSGKPDYRRIAAADPPRDASVQASHGTDVSRLLAIYAEALDRPDATPEDTFVSLGGDSLSYVEVSVRLEDALGEVPADWHQTPIRDLVPAPTRTLRSRAACAVDTSIALRAVAIVLVVGSHGNLFTLLGGAHLLVAVAGFNFARFHLLVEDTATRARRVAVSVRRIAVPTVAWVAVASLLLTDDYGVANLFLANAVAGPGSWDPSGASGSSRRWSTSCWQRWLSCRCPRCTGSSGERRSSWPCPWSPSACCSARR
jgi:hypothetical protein